MTGEGEKPDVPEVRDPSLAEIVLTEVPVQLTERRRPCLMAFLCSTMALVLAFLGLLEWDVPLTRFVRSLYHPVGYLPNPWLAQFSDIGDRLGRGESLAVLSLIILLVGLVLKQTLWKSAGWQSLLAHGAAALISNAVKHVVGRPRPKFMHAGNVGFSPGSGSGWDSFPSGHATASFAVAAVLAVRFPKFRWVIAAIAAAIAASRILRGAHFLTDTVGGAVIGWLAGMLVAHPWRDWRSSLADGVSSLSPLLATVFAVAWTVGHPPSDVWPEPQLIRGGILLTLLGLAGHARQAVRSRRTPGWLSMSLSQSLIGLGLSMTTGSLWVTTTVLCVCLAHWLNSRDVQPQASVSESTRSYLLTREVAFSLFILLGLLAGLELRGVLPMG